MSKILITKTDSAEFSYNPNKAEFAKIVSSKVGKLEAKGAAWHLLVAAQFVREDAKAHKETQTTYAQAFEGVSQGQLSKALTVFENWAPCAPLRSKEETPDNELVSAVIALVNEHGLQGLGKLADSFANKRESKQATLASLFQTVVTTGLSRGMTIEEINAVYAAVIETNGEGEGEGE